MSPYSKEINHLQPSLEMGMHPKLGQHLQFLFGLRSDGAALGRVPGVCTLLFFPVFLGPGCPVPALAGFIAVTSPSTPLGWVPCLPGLLLLPCLLLPPLPQARHRLLSFLSSFQSSTHWWGEWPPFRRSISALPGLRCCQTELSSPRGISLAVHHNGTHTRLGRPEPI